MPIDLAAIRPEQVAALLRPLSPHRRAAALARWEWLRRARPKQVPPPPGDWAVFLAMAGRGFGKTLLGAQEAWWHAAWNDGSRVAVVAPTSGDLRRVCFEGDSGILGVVPTECLRGGNPDDAYNRSLSEISLANGSIIQGFSASEPNRLRGPQFHFAWCLAGDTPVTMGDGSTRRMDTIRRGDLVLTRKGPRRVLASRMTAAAADVVKLTTYCGAIVLGTTNHRFYNPGRGFVPLSDLREGDELCRQTGSSGAAGSGGAARTATTATRTVGACIGPFMNPTTARSRRAMTSTTTTRTGATTRRKTSSPSPTASTSPTTGRANCPRQELQPPLVLPWLHSGETLRSATSFVPVAQRLSAPGPFLAASDCSVPRIVWNGSEGTPSSPSAAPAIAAVQSTSQSVASSVTARSGATPSKMKSAGQVRLRCPSFARTAATLSGPSAPTPGSAAGSVPFLTTARIASVERHPTPLPVYDLTVEGEPEFFASGLLAHNCDELAAWDRGVEAWDMLAMTLRLGDAPRIIGTTTPRPVPLVRSLVSRDGRDVLIVRGSTFENKDNLAAGFLQQLEERYGGTRLGRQEIEAELLDDVPGAIWTRGMIEEARIRELPDNLPSRSVPDYHRALASALGLIRIVVGVDPSGARSPDDESADEIGIVACGIDRAGKGYVLEDASGTYSPEGWGRATAEVFQRWKADRIVAEANFGGGMVESTIKAVRRTLPVTLVTASRGKAVRAEPVAALYEQGRVAHVGTFAALEDQLTSFTRTGYFGNGSPDRADAAIWCLTELMLGEGPSRIERFRALV